MMKATPKEKRWQRGGEAESEKEDKEAEETEKGKLSPGGLSGIGTTWSPDEYSPLGALTSAAGGNVVAVFCL